MQAKEQKLEGVNRASKSDHKTSTQLLMKALAEKNVPFNFVTSKYFQGYVAYITGMTYTAPSRWDLVRALEDISDIIAGKVKKLFQKAAYLGICADSWTSTGRHITAVTGGLPGTSIYLDSYENLGTGDAVTCASAIHDCMLVTMGLQQGMTQDDPAYPCGKVSVFTTDTTNLMPATGRQLCKYGMFTGCLWETCFSHIANLLLLDQLKVTSVAKLLAASKQITSTFRTGNFRKIFLMYVAANFVPFP
jgi:hypothetical protein